MSLEKLFNRPMGLHLLKQWEQLKEIIQTIEIDVAKSSRGILASNVRVRKALRKIKNLSKEIIKYSYEFEAAERADRKKYPKKTTNKAHFKSKDKTKNENSD